MYCKNYNAVCLNESCPDGIKIIGYNTSFSFGLPCDSTITLPDGTIDHIDPIIIYDVSGCEEAEKLLKRRNANENNV